MGQVARDVCEREVARTYELYGWSPQESIMLLTDESCVFYRFLHDIVDVL